MTPDKMQLITTTTTRQKMIAGVFAIVLLIIIWQIWGLFRGAGTETPAPTKTNVQMGAAGPGMSPQESKPQPTPLSARKMPMTPQESQVLQMQQATEEKYISAINELQMLKIQRDIAETNKAIMAARSDTIRAEKNIVDLLKPPPTPPIQESYARGLINPVQTGTAVPGQGQLAKPTIPTTQQQTIGAPEEMAQPQQPTEVNYTVISVSQLQNKWSAVLGYQGNLYLVSVGDVLPPDKSSVIGISRSGVVLEKDGKQKRVSLVPII